MNHTCLCLPSRSWSSFTDPGGMKGWVGLGTTTVSKQSAQKRYETPITVSYLLKPSRLTGQLAHRRAASNSRHVVLQAATLTTQPRSLLSGLEYGTYGVVAGSADELFEECSYRLVRLAVFQR